MSSAPVHVLCAGGAQVGFVWNASRSGLQRQLQVFSVGGRPFAEGLAATVLDPFLDRWRGVVGDERALLAGATDRSMKQCLEAFGSLRRCDAGKTDDALLAALAITANLQRTLMTLAERLARPVPREGKPPEPLRLCRDWCGLLPPRAACGSGRDRAVAKALGCAPGDVNRRCDDALNHLRRDLRGGKLLAREDWEPYANRSGVVRLRNSSM